MKRKLKQWYVKNPTNINKTNNRLSPQLIKHNKEHDTFKIQVLAWDRQPNVALLNRLMGSPPLLIIGLIDVQRALFSYIQYKNKYIEMREGCVSRLDDFWLLLEKNIESSDE